MRAWTRAKDGKVKGLNPEEIEDIYEAAKTSVQLEPTSTYFESWVQQFGKDSV